MIISFRCCSGSLYSLLRTKTRYLLFPDAHAPRKASEVVGVRALESVGTDPLQLTSLLGIYYILSRTNPLTAAHQNTIHICMGTASNGWKWSNSRHLHCSLENKVINIQLANLLNQDQYHVTRATYC